MDERERWLTAVQARLDRVETGQDLSAVLEEAAVTEARELERTLTDDPDSLPAMYLLGWLHWYRYEALPRGNDEQDLEVVRAAVTMLTPCFINGMSDLPEPLLPLIARQATRAAEELLGRTQGSGDPELLSAATDLLHRILAVTPADDPERVAVLWSVANSSRIRFERTGAAADLDAEITYWGEAAQALPADDPDRAACLSNLGMALLTRFERTGALADLDAAIEAGRQAVQAIPADQPRRAAVLSNFANAVLSRFEYTGALADLDAAIEAGRQAVQAAPAGHSDRAMCLSNLGNALRTRYKRTGVAADLDAAIEACQQAVQATPAEHPWRASVLTNLGVALDNRFGRTGLLADVDAAITQYREAVQATSADDPSRAGRLSNLGVALRARFERTGTATDLDAAIEASQQAVQAASAGHPDRAACLTNLGITLQARFDRSGVAADLDAAIEACEQAVQATPAGHPDRASRLSNLGNALRARFERSAAAADLDAAIEALQQAVQATPADHPARAMYLSNLGIAARARFQRSEVAADLDAAIEALQQAVQATPADHPDHARRLQNLGAVLQTRFGHTGAAADLDAAIEACEQAVQGTPADHPSRAARLSNLAAALHTRSGITGPTADLAAAIEACEQAVQATPADHPDRGAMLSNLGKMLESRFDRTGTLADLDAAIEAGRQAVRATPVGYFSRAARLGNLGNSLRTRFERTGAAADLDAAITCFREAVQATPADQPDRASYLSFLGYALRLRFERTGSAADIEAAVEACQQAVQATPAGDPVRASPLTNLGNALLARYQRTGSPADVEAAITGYREAVQVTPAGGSGHGRRLSNLGGALQARFERTGAAADLDAAVEAGKQAVQATPVSHPELAMYLSNLANALRIRFERTAETADLDAALHWYTQAADVDTAAASLRIGAGRAAALLVAKTDPARAASLLEAAVALFPEVAPRFLERGDQQYAIRRFAGLAADAAAAALSDPAEPEARRPARALRLLEAARGLLLSQALSTRSDLSELREHHPKLAARFTELRDWLDRPAPVADPDLGDLPGEKNADSPERAIRDRRHAEAEFTQLLARIRALEGFGAFALPPAAEQLAAQADRGPVVVFNVSALRSDAILLTRGGTFSQPLPGLDQVTVNSQINVFYRALNTIPGAESPRAKARAQEEIRQVLAWLWDNAAGPVLDTLGYREQPASGKPWPRVWWVPGGLLSLLPIHAAGHHTDPPDPAGRSVMDRVISSYTPTVGALAHARAAQAAGGAGAAERSLIVAMPTTPDLPGGELEYVSVEADLVRARLPRPTVLSEPATDDDTTPGQLPTKAAVLEHLAGVGIAHFACHGSTDPADPSQSQLLLHDHLRDPLTVAALAPLVLDHAQLAYLSACSTARVADTRLLDEAIHLTSAFQLAGFPRVIGTLWAINDAIAVEIASNFYTALTNPDGSIDCHSAARALHHATRTLRDRRPGAPYLWASHIHAGA